MAEYFNTYSKEYLSSLKKKSQRYLVKLELLSNSEKVIGEIVKDLESVGGQINVNYEQITRRSCSLAITDVRKKYLPSKNSTFWFNRKFKLWIGLIVHDNIYWWAQGVYYTTSATSEGRNLNIEAVDKGGVLDGTLKIGMSSYQYTINQGTGLVYALKKTLARQVGALDVVYRGNMKMGGDNPIDVIPPRIHTMYKNQIVQTEITLDRNAYFGDMITQLADLYAADAYYDVNGNFKFEPYIINSGYSYSPTLWSFTDLSSTFENANYSTTFDSENSVCVYTNASGEGIVNVAYTAYNTNPLSPCNIGIGIRRAQDIEIPYNLMDNSEEIEEYKSDLAEVESEIVQYGININQTVYGNIDTNNRQKLVWTQETIDQNADALESWGYDNPEELLGTYSTVMGMSEEFDNVEVAFSPIWQTPNGAILLGANTTRYYINQLISNLGEGWTTEDLLAADAVGTVVVSLPIKELIADAGETAIHTGIAMHYVGKDGALAIAQQNLYDAEHANEIQQIKDCRSAAVYYLKKNSMLGIQFSFSCPLIPHLDVNKTIEINDQWHDIANGIFVIQSITMPLGANAMEISATNINWLPNDMEFDGTSELLGEE